MAKVQKIKGAIEIVEEAVTVLKHYSISILPIYYVGALPFILAFSYFWTDMSHSSFAKDHIVAESLLIALLFIWMKCWHAVYCRKVLAIIRHEASPRWSVKQVLCLISSQGFFAGTSAIILPVAMVIAIPFGWVYAFYQHIAVADNSQRSVKDIFNSAWQSANIWPGQNHLILCILSVVSFFILLNVGVAVYYLPILLKTLFGIDTIFTLSGLSVFNTTFLIIVTGLTYLIVDPLTKTVYTLRSFYISSVKSGDDILTDLLNLKAVSKGLACILFFILVTACSSAAASDKRDIEVKDTSTVRLAPSEEIDKSIEEVTRNWEFAWRMENKKIDDETDIGAIERFIFWIRDNIEKARKYIFEKIGKLLKKIFGTRKIGTSGGLWRSNVYLILYSILAVLLCILAVAIWRQYQKKRRPVVKIAGQGIPSIPDLTDDYVNPVELPADRWL
ncbi:MAG: hypothetical protein JXL81_10240, partial [Deltaproteobacteria bacterium]|nr:hypothetical protein [Deltaproteobacteria bacterium]